MIKKKANNTKKSSYNDRPIGQIIKDEAGEFISEAGRQLLGANETKKDKEFSLEESEKRTMAMRQTQQVEADSGDLAKARKRLGEIKREAEEARAKINRERSSDDTEEKEPVVRGLAPLSQELPKRKQHLPPMAQRGGQPEKRQRR